MRILFVLENHYPNVGGVETLFKSLSESLVSEGHDVTVLTNRFSKELQSKETLNGVKIVRPQFYNRYLFTLFAIFPVIKYSRNHDLIHTTSYNAGLPAILGGILTGKKVVITFHEVWGHLWNRLPYFNKLSTVTHSAFEKLLLKLPFEKFIAVSRFTAESLQRNGVKESKVKQIYNGIDYKSLNHNSKDQPIKNKRFLFFGRLGISKGIDLLIRSFSILKKEGVEVKLDLIIPSEPASFYQTVRREIEEFKVSDIIHIQNSLHYNKLKAKIKACQAVIIPSYSEGFCYAAVESIGLGAKIISSDQGALKEVVCGEFIKMKQQSPEGLATAIKEALQGQWESSPVKEFHLSQTIEEYTSLYTEVLGE